VEAFCKKRGIATFGHDTPQTCNVFFVIEDLGPFTDFDAKGDIHGTDVWTNANKNIAGVVGPVVMKWTHTSASRSQVSTTKLRLNVNVLRWGVKEVEMDTSIFHGSKRKRRRSLTHAWPALYQWHWLGGPPDLAWEIVADQSECS
jgi:hypothetical protein